MTGGTRLFVGGSFVTIGAQGASAMSANNAIFIDPITGGAQP
jgi:hypothetical protein